MSAPAADVPSREVRFVDCAEGETTKFFCNFTGVGGPEIAGEYVDGFEVYDYPVDMEARSEAPRDLAGISGSGMWQMRLRRKDWHPRTRGANRFRHDPLSGGQH